MHIVALRAAEIKSISSFGGILKCKICHNGRYSQYNLFLKVISVC